MIDSQMDDMIREKLALKEQIDSLEQNLSKQIKETESVLQIFSVFKNESKEKKNKYMENEIDLEKKIKELNNIVYKVGQSAQTVHMLTKPQAFYDNIHKQALSYQNPFYLRKAQQIKPTLYDGAVISKTHVAMPLNRLTKDFGKRFTPQQELSAKQAFWLHISNPSIEPSYTPPVIVDVPSELPKVSLVNASLKKIKFHLTQFDYVVKKRTTPSALEEVDKQCLKIAEKETLLEIDRLLQKIVSQDVLLTVMNFLPLNNESVNIEMKKCDSCEKCLSLDSELSKSKQVYNNLLKKHSQLEKHCISLEVSMQLKQEVFQNDESFVSQNAVEIPEYFKINDLKAQLQNKDTTICKLKDTIKSLRKNTKDENVNHVKCDLEPINEEMKNKNEDLKAQIQDKVFVITSLKNNLRKSKGKEIVENVVHIPSTTTIAPGMFKLELEPLPPRLLQNREVHLDYLNNTQEQANILRGLVEQAKAKQPLDGNSDLACKYTTRIQELLVYVQDTCPNAITHSSKKVAVTPMNKGKKVRGISQVLGSVSLDGMMWSLDSKGSLPWILLLALRGRSTGSQMCPLRNMNIGSLTVTVDYFYKADRLANLCAKVSDTSAINGLSSSFS
ncbi:hypothetical protein Tco_0669341 [Tanacetum coccineum]